MRIKVRNRLLINEPVSGASLEFDRPAVGPVQFSGVTNHQGIADINITGIPDGAHTLRVMPADVSTDPVGPATAAAPTPPIRIFRPLEIQLRTLRGTVTAANVATGGFSGAVSLAHDPRIVIDLQPVWMSSPNHGRRTHNLTMVIVHHTGGDRIQGALHEFLTGTRGVSAHYVIDTDGQVVKMVQDSQRANHAGGAQWGGLKSLNARSIGIEIVNGTAEYAEAQYVTLINLLGRLLAAHTTIDRQKIIGHSDIATDGAGVLGRKSGDPGLRFQWVRLENQLLGMLPRVGPIRPDTYGGFFVHYPAGSLRSGDVDSRRRFGGQVRNDITGTPINELQADLQSIGYSVGRPDGDFGNRTRAAVMMFQEHYFAGGRGPAPTGQVDRFTADMIKMVC